MQNNEHKSYKRKASLSYKEYQEIRQVFLLTFHNLAHIPSQSSLKFQDFLLVLFMLKDFLLF